jgi:hypothetical protein
MKELMAFGFKKLTPRLWQKKFVNFSWIKTGAQISKIIPLSMPGDMIGLISAKSTMIIFQSCLIMVGDTANHD